MITETTSHKNNPALTSDCWHVVHARWTHESEAEPKFERSIIGEHTDRRGATEAAKSLWATLKTEMAARPASTRDQLFVRRPGFKSLRHSGRLEHRK